jgi:hypothetical protein
MTLSVPYLTSQVWFPERPSFGQNCWNRRACGATLRAFKTCRTCRSVFQQLPALIWRIVFVENLNGCILGRPVIHIAVVVRRLRVHSNFNVADTLDVDLSRERAEMSIPYAPAFSITRAERRTVHPRLESADDGHPDFESPTCLLCLRLDRTLCLGQSIPGRVRPSFKVDEGGPQSSSTLLRACLPKTVVVNTSHGHDLIAEAREIS